MGIKTFFFDTYALFEIIEGNNNYKSYLKDVVIVTTKLNLMELHYGLFLKYGKEVANKYYNKFVVFAIDIDDEVIKIANEFKAELRKRKLSYIDCIGYTIARINNIKFLTGDQQFFDLDN